MCEQLEHGQGPVGGQPRVVSAWGKRTGTRTTTRKKGAGWGEFVCVFRKEEEEEEEEVEAIT